MPVATLTFTLPEEQADFDAARFVQNHLPNVARAKNIRP
jgi:hypothetical protein